MGKNPNVYDEIKRVAYALYEQRGRVHGYDLKDWLEAEMVVLGRHAKEIEKEADIIRSSKGKKASGKAEPKTVKTSKKTSESSAQIKTRTSPAKKKT